MAEEKVSDKEAKERIRTCLKKSGSECDDLYTYLVEKGLADGAIQNLWLEVSKDIQKDAQANADKQKKQKVKVTYVWYQFEDLAESEDFKTNHQKPDPSRCLDNQKEANVREKVTAKIDIGRIKWKAGKAVIGLGASTDPNYWYWNAMEFELKSPVQGKPVITSINNGKPVDYTIEHVPIAGQFLGSVERGGIAQADPSTSADIGRIISIPLKDLNYLTIEATAATFIVPNNLQDGHYWLVLENNLGTASKDFELKRTVPAEGWTVKIMKPKDDGAELKKTHPFGDFYIGFHILGIDIRQIESIQLVVVGPNKRFEHNARVDKLKMVPLGSPFSYSVLEGLAQNIIDQLVVGEEYKITLIVRDKFHVSKFDTKRVKVVGPKTIPKPEEKEEVEKIKKDLDEISEDEKEIKRKREKVKVTIDKEIPYRDKIMRDLQAMKKTLEEAKSQGGIFREKEAAKNVIDSLNKLDGQIRRLNNDFLPWLLKAVNEVEEKLIFKEDQEAEDLAIKIQEHFNLPKWEEQDRNAPTMYQNCLGYAKQLSKIIAERNNSMRVVKQRYIPYIQNKYNNRKIEQGFIRGIIADLEKNKLDEAIKKLEKLFDDFVMVHKHIASIRQHLKDVDEYTKRIDTPIMLEQIRKFVTNTEPQIK